MDWLREGLICPNPKRGEGLFKYCPTGQHMATGFDSRGHDAAECLETEAGDVEMQRLDLDSQDPGTGRTDQDQDQDQDPSAGGFPAQMCTCVRDLLAAEGFNIRTFGAKTHCRPNAGPLEDALLG